MVRVPPQRDERSAPKSLETFLRKGSSPIPLWLQGLYPKGFADFFPVAMAQVCMVKYR